MDGVELVTRGLIGVLQAHGLKPSLAEERTRARGYFARHVYFEYPRTFNFSRTCTAQVMCEVQIATELSTTIWDRTHGAYELARVAEDDDLSWHWDGNDPQFLASQLAHMIHLADGLIVRLRDRVRETKGQKK
jgi:hypothetical protein